MLRPNQTSEPQIAHRVPRGLALLLVCATFPLIWVGGLVTTYDAGMAVPDWPSTYGYNLFLYPLSSWWAGPWDLFIEHGHRLLGAAVGMIAIALLISVWAVDSRRWLRWYVSGCLLLVIAQGMLGGARVLLDQRTLARLHGCIGPLFFASAVAAAVFLGRHWRAPDQFRLIRPGTSLRASTLVLGAGVTLLAYGQLVLGSFLRHPLTMGTPYEFRVMVLAHVMVAMILAASAILLTVQVWRVAASKMRRASLTLVLLICLQITLGVATWTVQYAWPSFLPTIAWFQRFIVAAESMTQAITVTSHVAVGSLILANSLYLTLHMARSTARRVVSNRPDATPVSQDSFQTAEFA